MSNVYYSASGNPATGAAGTSATIRAEFNAIVAAFDKMPTPTGNAGKHLLVDPYGTSLTVSSAITESAGVVTITGATVLDATANIAGSALVTLAASQTLTSKTLTAPVIATINNGGTLTLPTGPQTLVGRTTTDTLTNKTLTNPVINGFTGDTSAINVGSGQIVKDTAGNLMLGTTTPAGTLTVRGGTGAINATFDTPTAGDTRIEFKNNGTRAGYLYWDTNEVRHLSDGTRYQTFYTNGSERVRIDSSGNLGIGTTPAQKFHVYGSSSVASLVQSSGATTGQVGWSIKNDVNNAATFAMYNSTQTAFGAISPGEVFLYSSSPGLTIATDTAGAPIKFATGTSNAERMRIGASGNLLVGATAAVSSERARIENTSAGAVPNTLCLTNAGTTVGTGANLSFVSYTNATVASTIASISGISSDTSGNGLLAFNTSGVERMRLDASGRLIVGGTSAAARIHSVVADGTQAFGVSGTTKGLRINTDANKVNVQGVDSTIGGSYQPIAIGGSTVTLQYNGTTDGLLLDAGGNLGISQTPSAWGAGFNAIQTKGGAVYSATTGNMVIGQNFYDNGSAAVRLTANPCSFYMQSGGAHQWGYAPTGTAGSTFTTWTEVMRVGNDGVLRVGNTAGNPNPGITMNPTGAVYIGNSAEADGWGFLGFFRSGVAIGNVAQSGSGTSVAYNTTSDVRLKTNIQEAADAGNVVDRIRIVQYDWKSTGCHVDFGVIAQELHEVFPDAVTPGDDDRPWAWDASFLVPLLVKEIQALRSRVSALESA